MNRISSFRLPVLAALLVSLLLAGCAASGGAKKQESLAERAQARWDFLAAKEPENAWHYLSRGTRAMTPQNQYIKETLVKPVKWTGARFLKQECATPKTCKVYMMVDYKIRSHLSGVGVIETSQMVEETWINESGTWYFLPSE